MLAVPLVFFRREAVMAGQIAAVLLAISMGVFAAISVWLACFEGRSDK